MSEAFVPKFVQLANDGDGLVALDADGIVWDWTATEFLVGVPKAWGWRPRGLGSDALRAECDALRADLAASQAHAKALREALEKAQPFIAGWSGFEDAGVQRDFDECAKVLATALALPADTSALAAIRALEPRP